jgi:hypothetical protein
MIQARHVFAQLLVASVLVAAIVCVLHAIAANVQIATVVR